MKIHIAGLPAGFGKITTQVSQADLKLDPAVYPHPLEVVVSTEKNGGRIFLAIHTSIDGHFICDRCGEEFSREVGGNCMVVFIQRDAPLPDEMPGDDLRTFRLGQDELDITTEVRDALLLSIPLKLLCREDCRGICTVCGANLNHEECPHRN